MIPVVITNSAFLVVAVWAIWVRRDTLHSRWDASITAAIGLFAVGAVLDGPWPSVAAASFPVTGKYYVFTAFGHGFYLFGAALGLRAVCLRLMADSAIESLMSRVRLVVMAAAALLVACVLASPTTSTMPAPSLFLVPPDGWLVTYWAVYFLTLMGLNTVALYGAHHLRGDPRQLMLGLLAAATVVGNLVCVGFLLAIATEKTDLVEKLLWPSGYVAMIAGSVALAVSWRHRAQEMLPPSVAPPGS